MADEVNLASIKSNLYVLFNSVHWYFRHLNTKRLKVSPEIKHQMCCVIADMVKLENGASPPFYLKTYPFCRLLSEMSPGFFYELCRQKTETDEHLWRQLEHSVTELNAILKAIYNDEQYTTITTAMEACNLNK